MHFTIIIIMTVKKQCLPMNGKATRRPFFPPWTKAKEREVCVKYKEREMRLKDKSWKERLENDVHIHINEYQH